MKFIMLCARYMHAMKGWHDLLISLFFSCVWSFPGLETISNNYERDFQRHHIFVLFPRGFNTEEERAGFEKLNLLVEKLRLEIYFEHTIPKNDSKSWLSTTLSIQSDRQPFSMCRAPFCYVHFAPITKDRSCLVSLNVEETRIFTVMPIINVSSSHLLEEMVNFTNVKANVFRDINGEANPPGKLLARNFLFDISVDNQSCPWVEYRDVARLFASEFWLPQRPVVIRNYPIADITTPMETQNGSTSTVVNRNAATWKLLQSFGQKKVGVKLSPNNDFEGIDSLLNWKMAATQKVPRNILDQMQSPDLVVVRAAHYDMPLAEVMALIGANRSSLLLPFPSLPDPFISPSPFHLNSFYSSILSVLKPRFLFPSHFPVPPTPSSPSLIPSLPISSFLPQVPLFHGLHYFYCSEAFSSSI